MTSKSKGAAGSDHEMGGISGGCRRVACVGVLVAVSGGSAHAQAGWPLQQLWQERCQPPASPGCTG
jgi:hypothetical protein